MKVKGSLLQASAFGLLDIEVSNAWVPRNCFSLDMRSGLGYERMTYPGEVMGS